MPTRVTYRIALSLAGHPERLVHTGKGGSGALDASRPRRMASQRVIQSARPQFQDKSHQLLWRACSTRITYLYDLTSWWLHDVRVERRTCNRRSTPLPRCVAGAGRCPPEDAGGPERYMNALEVHSEHEFLEWIETLRGSQIEVNDLRVEVDEWLIWLDRCFDRCAANERLQTLAR